MVFFSNQKKQLKDAKEFQEQLMKDHKVLSEELKEAHEMQAELQEESKQSQLALEKAQKVSAELQEEKKEALAALAEERALLAEREAEFADKLKIEEKNYDSDMAQAVDKENKAKASIAVLEEESKSLQAEEKKLRADIDKHRGVLQAIQSDSGTIARDLDVNDPRLNMAVTDDEKLEAIREEKLKVEKAREENEKILNSLETAIESANSATRIAEARYAEVATELADEEARTKYLQQGGDEQHPSTCVSTGKVYTGTAKQQLEELQKDNTALAEEIKTREAEVQEAKNLLEVANQNAEAIAYEMQRNNGVDSAKAEEELQAISAEEIVAREEAEMAEMERKKLEDEVSAAKAELSELQKDMFVDSAASKVLLEESNVRIAEAEDRLKAVLADKEWHQENLEKLKLSHAQSQKETQEVLEELSSMKKYHGQLPAELKEIKEAQNRVEQEEIGFQREHDDALLQARFGRAAVEAQLKEHANIFNGATSIPQALDNWKSAQSQIEDELRKALAEQDGLAGQIAGLEPLLQAANDMHQDRQKALDEVRKDCETLREEQKSAALQEQDAAVKLQDAKIAYQTEEAELRDQLQLAKAKLFEARQEHRQLQGDLSTAKGRLSEKANSYSEHRAACGDTVDSLVKTKRDTDMVYWLHGDEPRDLLHHALQSPPQKTSKLASAGSSIFK